MAYNYEYPYVDPERYNSDWLINKVKDLEAEWKNSDLINKYNSLYDYVKNYFDNLDVNEEISNKLDAMLESGALTPLLNQGDTLFSFPTSSRVSTSGGSTLVYQMDVPHNTTNNVKTLWHCGISVSPVRPDYFARANGFPLVINGGIFSTSPIGVVIIDGEIIQEGPYTAENPYDYDAFFIDSENNMHIIRHGASYTATQLKSLGAYNSLSGFAGVVVNGEAINNPLWGNKDSNPRIALCQKQDGSYFILETGGRGLFNDSGLTYEEIGQIALQRGAYNAYCLDGGGSAQISVNGVAFTRPIDNNGTSYRPVSSFLFIKGDYEAKSSNLYNIAETVQMVSDIYYRYSYRADGLLQLRGSDSNAALEFWSNFSTTRNAAFKASAVQGFESLVGSVYDNGVNNVVFRAYNITNENTQLRGLWDGYGRLAPLYNAPPVLDDINTIDSNSGYTAYRFRATSANTPEPKSYGVLDRKWYGDGSFIDIAYTFTDKIYVRTYVNGSFTPFKKLEFVST